MHEMSLQIKVLPANNGNFVVSFVILLSVSYFMEIEGRRKWVPSISGISCFHLFMQEREGDRGVNTAGAGGGGVFVLKSRVGYRIL